MTSEYDIPRTTQGFDIDEASTRIDALRAENANLRTVMVAAAEEIAAHWDAHCDAEGYGPQNLQRRLEEGIPSEYGYTAGAFAALRLELENSKATEASLRARCEAGEVLLREVRIIVPEQYETRDRIDAHLKGANHG